MVRSNRIGVGIIGANPDRGWAKTAHIPALRALDDFAIAAISTSRPESAKAASELYGVADSFADHHALVTHPGVDLVAVTVKVPNHRELVDAALDAGKMVFCEWPLGRDLADAEAMANKARAKGIRTVIGTQAHGSPVIRYVRELIASGSIGKVLSTTMFGAGGTWNGRINEQAIYITDNSNGANMRTIALGHSVEGLCFALGAEFTELVAHSAISRKTLTVIETGETIVPTSEDQFAVAGTLIGGIFADIHFRGAGSRGTNLLWEINGTEGDLLLTGPGGGSQIATLTLAGGTGEARTVTQMPVPDRFALVPGAPAGPPFNVAQLYAQLAADISNDTTIAPSFDTAVTRHRMLDAAERAAQTGVRQRL